MAVLALASAIVAQSATTAADPPGPRVVPLVGELPVTSAREFTFLVGGHLYGDPGIVSTMPSHTFVAAVDDLAGQGDLFFASCGDLFRAFAELVVDPTMFVLKQLEMPVFNAPGNHDVAEDYVKRFGEGYGCHRVGSALLVLLNTELDVWQITGAQLEFLRAAAAWAGSQPDIEHVFVFAHKLLFAANNERYAVLLSHENASDGFEGASNFERDVRPLLDELAADKQVVWFGGNLGVSWSRSLFWDRDPESGVVYAAVGLGNTQRDCLLRVHVRPGEVELEPMPLSQGARIAVGDPVSGRIEDYGLDWWRAQFPAKSGGDDGTVRGR